VAQRFDRTVQKASVIGDRRIVMNVLRGHDDAELQAAFA
jgi:hypothetical protein